MTKTSISMPGAIQTHRQAALIEAKILKETRQTV